MFTLTIVFNKEMDKVLLCHHTKKNIYNFIGGTIEECEDPMKASYRELYEETGISESDVELYFLQQESVTLWDNDVWNIYVTVGVLNKDVILKEEKNSLLWVEDWDFLRTCGYDGDCALYLNRAMKLLCKKYSS